MISSSDACEMVHDGTDTNGDEWNRCTVHGYLVLGDAYVCEGYEAPPYDPDAGRDRLKSPSINFPQSSDEAFMALLHAVVRTTLVDDGTLCRTFTTDAGLGHTRTQQQADWLTNAQSLLRAWLEDDLEAIGASVIKNAGSSTRAGTS